MIGIFLKFVVPIGMAIQLGCVSSFHVIPTKNLGKQSPDHVQDIKKCVVDYADGLDKVHKGLGNSVRGHPLAAKTTLKHNVIFGAGFGSTATRSLDTALTLLGLRGDHYSDIMAPLRNALALPHCGLKVDYFFRDRRTFQRIKDYILDTPMAELFLDFFMTFSEAKFILTTRPADTWALARSQKSASDIYMPRERPCADLLKDQPMDNISYMFSLHNELVRCVVPKNRLFEIDVWSDPPERIKHVMENLSMFTGKNLSQDPLKAIFKTVSTNSINNTTQHCTSKSLHNFMSSFTQRMPPPANEVTISVVHGDLRVKILPREFGALMQAAVLEDCEIVMEKHQ